MNSFNKLMNVTNQRSILNVLHIEGDERIDVDIMMLASMDLSHLFHLFANRVVQLARVHIRLKCRDVADCKMRQ